MSCHYRIATREASIGQPEVQLGIIPGAGGTQRLPRLCGAAMAVQMCTVGKPVAAARALAAGIVDQVAAGGLLDDAVAFARSKAGDPIRRTRELTAAVADREAGMAACKTARAALEGSARGLVAPFRAVEAIEAALTLDFDAGS